MKKKYLLLKKFSFICICIIIFPSNEIYGYQYAPFLYNKAEKLLVLNKLIELDPNKNLLLPLLHKNLEKMVKIDEDLWKALDNYLMSQRETTLSNEEHNLENLWNALDKSCSELNLYLEKNCLREKVLFKNSQTLHDILRQSFSHEYLKKKRNSILGIISYLQVKNIYYCDLEVRKEIVYRDMEFRTYSRFFYSDFLQIIQMEIDNQKFDLKNLEDLQSIILLYMKLLDKRNFNLYYPIFMRWFYEQNRAQQYPPELLSFLSNLAPFQKTFSYDASPLLEKIDAEE